MASAASKFLADLPNLTDAGALVAWRKLGPASQLVVHRALQARPYLIPKPAEQIAPTTMRPTKAELTAPLTRFIQEVVGDTWHTLVGVTDTETAYAQLTSAGAIRGEVGIWTTPMGRKYRVLTDDGRLVV